MKVLDLYCGAGGFSEGFKQAGFNIESAVDLWPTALDSHEVNHRITKHFKMDITAKKTLDFFCHSNFDVIIGSPPCVDFSIASKSPDLVTGLTLTDSFLDFVEAISPEYWVMENVVGVRPYVEGRIRKLGGRIYTLDAANYGTPQFRKRLFAGRFPFPHPTHMEIAQNNLLGKPIKKWLTAGEALADINEHDLPEDEDLEPTQKTLERVIQILNKEGIYLKPLIHRDKPAHTIMAHLAKDFTFGGIIERKFVKTTFPEQHGKLVYPDDEPSPTLTTNASKLIQLINQNKADGRIDPQFCESDKPALTITTKHRSSQFLMLDEIRQWIRRISTLEAQILMGFPKDYYFHGSRSSKFRQIGNAVCPPVAKAIANEILDTNERNT